MSRRTYGTRDREAALPTLAHHPVSRTFLLSSEANLYRRSNGNSMHVEIDTGRMLAEVLLTGAFSGFLLAATPRTSDLAQN